MVENVEHRLCRLRSVIRVYNYVLCNKTVLHRVMFVFSLATLCVVRYGLSGLVSVRPSQAVYDRNG